ncbi:MAG: hypothetical protein K9G60_13230 [Pseudolabrys sp.]|nr:hypothetical protein [Pseudolabrys sp.]
MQLDAHGTDHVLRSHARTVSQMRTVLACAQCGERHLIPEWSEWLDPGHARHLWQCDACGYSFETTVQFAAA